MTNCTPADALTDSQAAAKARIVIAKVSEWADGMPGASDAERLREIRRIVRTYERDVLGIVTAPIDQAEAVSGE